MSIFSPNPIPKLQEILNRLLGSPKGTDDDPVRSTLIGRNAADGSPISGVSFELDDNGYPVMRVVDAAPFAYDPDQGVFIQRGLPVAEVVVYNEVAVRDTSPVIINPLVDVSAYRSCQWFATNTLKAGGANVNVDLKLRAPHGARSMDRWDGAAWTEADTTTILGNGRLHHINSALTFLDKPWKGIGGRFTASATPDEGYFHLMFVGEPR